MFLDRLVVQKRSCVMLNRLTTKGPGVRGHRSPVWLLPCLAIGVLMPSLVFAQPIAMQLKSALYWVLGGQTLIVTVAELGDTDEASLVSIEIRDATNAVRASITNRTLTPGRPVILSAQVPAGIRLQQLGAVVTVAIPTSPEFHQPTVSMEVFDPTSLRIRTLPPCAIPIDQMPSEGGGAVGSCDGWHKTSGTAGAQ
jgi:hypothetical protein